MIKRRDLIRELIAHGCVSVKGTKHEKFVAPSGQYSEVPRHREINDILADKIRKQLGIK